MVSDQQNDVQQRQKLAAEVVSRLNNGKEIKIKILHATTTKAVEMANVLTGMLGNFGFNQVSTENTSALNRSRKESGPEKIIEMLKPDDEAVITIAHPGVLKQLPDHFKQRLTPVNWPP